jgi:hypothetical protein
MKSSRDLTREKLNDPSFDEVIDTQMAAISKTGASHVAIATPYDHEFVSFLSRWVTAAHKYKLHVWFRGNFSGWEKWFDYPSITRQEHAELLKTFITDNPSLFSDGDIFTPCPECENGGPGDPRKTGDTAGYQQFLITEYQIANDAFRHIGKNVTVGYFSMNYDVANVIMDRQTTAALGGVVTIDHYVKTPNQIVSDIRAIAEKSGGKVFLGEFGAPIPDIHGDMSEQEQASWIAETLRLLSKEPEVIGMSYWVNLGGSTQIWNDDNSPRKAVGALTEFFLPKTIGGRLLDQFNEPITDALITISDRKYHSDSFGRFNLPLMNADSTMTISHKDYPDMTVLIDNFTNGDSIVIDKKSVSLMDWILGLLNR